MNVASRYIKKTAASYPVSLEDWEPYIKTLAGEVLYSKLLAVNTQKFADMLREEGLTMADFQKIVLLFVRQCAALDVRLPQGGALNLKVMAQSDPTCRKGPTVSPESAAALETKTPPATTDDVDQMLSELEAD